MPLCAINPLKNEMLRQKRQVDLAERLMKYIIENCSTPLCIKEICRACGVSATAANVAFKAYWKVTPINFLRILRLHGANRDLLKAKNSVTDVALDWGFVHFGRFSYYYRKEFGELPSLTLQAAQQRRGFPTTEIQDLSERLWRRFKINLRASEVAERNCF